MVRQYLVSNIWWKNQHTVFPYSLCNSETKFTQLILVQNFSNIVTVFNIDDVPVSMKQLKTGEESNCSEIGWRNYFF